jgi:hypothetical protein
MCWVEVARQVVADIELVGPAQQVSIGDFIACLDFAVN